MFEVTTMVDGGGVPSGYKVRNIASVGGTTGVKSFLGPHLGVRTSLLEKIVS